MWYVLAKYLPTISVNITMAIYQIVIRQNVDLSLDKKYNAKTRQSSSIYELIVGTINFRALNMSICVAIFPVIENVLQHQFTTIITKLWT